MVDANAPSRTRLKAALKEWTIRFTLLGGSLLVAFAIVEVVLRLFFPLYGGRDNITTDGRSIQTFLDPGVVYRQLSNEYDALTTITAKGYRAPAVAGNPDVVFVGDSFTFGFGLTDGETFASIYCQHYGIQCANLGQPGSGTLRQVRRLRQYLDDMQWRPRFVKLFFFGMGRSFSSGNDFVDNYNFGQYLDRQASTGVVRASQSPAPATQSAPLAAPKPRRGFGEWVISWQEALLMNVHVVRHIKYNWGPRMRTLILAEPGEQRTETAVNYTSRAFRELDALSKERGFDYEVYLIVPSHDIIMRSDGDTLSLLNRTTVAPAITTSHLYQDSPQSYYYSYDGHLNAKGSRRLAEFLIARDASRHQRAGKR